MEVIDLNRHIDDGSYKSLYMHQIQHVLAFRNERVRLDVNETPSRRALERRAITLFKTSKGRNLSLREQLEKAHRRYGHVAPKGLVGFKKMGRIYSSLIPDKGRLEFKAKHCPICLPMKGKKPGKPSKLNLHDKAKLGLWEKVCVDTAGKFRVASC